MACPVPSGLRVANLARQGDCAFQEAYLLTEYLPVFHPRAVFYHFFENDIADVYTYLSDEQMREFIATLIEAIRYPERLPMAAALLERDRAIRRRTVTGWLRMFYVPFIYPWVKELARATVLRPQRPPPTVAEDEDWLGWQYIPDRSVSHGAGIRVARGSD